VSDIHPGFTNNQDDENPRMNAEDLQRWFKVVVEGIKEKQSNS
jgi:hypothetical protein